MQHVSSIAHPFYSYGNRKRSKRPSIAIERLSKREEDQVLDSYPELISENYRGWCVNRLRALGRKEFVKIADRAMKHGDNRQKLFVYLIK